MRIDLHVHTNLSSDSVMTLGEIIRAVQRRGLDGVAITDHNAIAGAFRLREIVPFLVIVGEEVKTTEGEIIGLFLHERIPPDLSPEETIAAIRAQGGIVYIPHPFDHIRRSAIGRRTLARIINQVDAIEVFNARNIIPQDNSLARQVAHNHGLAMGAGSDAHLPFEIGNGYVEMGAFSDPTSFLAALRHGQAKGRLTTPFIHGLTRLTKIYRRVSGKSTRS